MNAGVQLVMEFLRENNLIRTLDVLSDETGVYYNNITNREDFVQNVKKGQWNIVLR